MSLRQGRMIWCGLVLLLSSGCGDNLTKGNDAAPPTDARFLSDASVEACSADSNSCADLAFERQCDLERSRCVECLSPADCTAPSLGPICNSERNTCQCDSSEACSNNEYGHYCHPLVKACGCITDDECESGRECKLEPYLGTGIRTCQLSPAP